MRRMHWFAQRFHDRLALTMRTNSEGTFTILPPTVLESTVLEKMPEEE